jgi:hypothetical protein
LWGDPEIEFAVLDDCGISEPAFWEGYGAGRDRSPEAEVRRVFYLLYEVQKYIVIRRVRGDDPGRADAYRRHSLQLAQGLEEDRMGDRSEGRHHPQRLISPWSSSTPPTSAPGTAHH